MLPIRWRAEAQADLATILGYIAERDQQAATYLYTEIDSAVSQLPHHPYLYRVGRVADTHEMVVRRNYVVVYRVDVAVIEILSVIHARQQYP